MMEEDFSNVGTPKLGRPNEGGDACSAGRVLRASWSVCSASLEISALVSSRYGMPQMDEKLKVLVAEDDETLQEVLAATLSHDVTIASDGEECLELLRTQRFDLLLLDIMLPRVSGVTLLRMVKDEYPELGVVAMTGFADTIRQQILAMGVDAFVAKPYGPEEIRAAVQQAAAKRHKPTQEP